MLIVAGLIAGVELQALEHGIDGTALAAACAALGMIAGVIGRSIFPRRPAR